MNPEDNKQQAAPTTVGGVTFGGGTPPVEPAQNATNAPAQQPGVDPIVTTTGEEFDAVMNGTAAPVRDFNQAPIPNTMSTQVASPTHFDTQNTVKPIVMDPGTPGINDPQAQKAKKDKKEKTPEELDKQVKKFSTMAVIFGILTAIFTVLAVVGLVLYLNTVTEVTMARTQRDNLQEVLNVVSEKSGVQISKVEDVPNFVATTGYIYLSDWGIKIQIPENLKHVSYILNNINYHQSICFNAVGDQIQQFPDFANIGLNPGKMGCLTRIETTEGEFDAITGQSYGEKVFTYKDYSYFYTGPTYYSKDEANLRLEKTAAQYIQQMLKDRVSKYEF